jgi:hypothetical protein
MDPHLDRATHSLPRSIPHSRQQQHRRPVQPRRVSDHPGRAAAGHPSTPSTPSTPRQAATRGAPWGAPTCRARSADPRRLRPVERLQARAHGGQQLRDLRQLAGGREGGLAGRALRRRRLAARLGRVQPRADRRPEVRRVLRQDRLPVRLREGRRGGRQAAWSAAGWSAAGWSASSAGCDARVAVVVVRRRGAARARGGAAHAAREKADLPGSSRGCGW